MVATATRTKKAKSSPRVKARKGRGLKAEIAGEFRQRGLLAGEGCNPTTQAEPPGGAGEPAADADQADATPSAGEVVKLGKKRLTVEFGGMAAGDGTASIGVRILRTLLSLQEADDAFCGRELTGEIKTLPGQDAAGQKHISDGDKPIVDTHEIKASFEVSKFSASPKHITIRLTFNITSIDPGELARFSKKAGVLTINGVRVAEKKKRGRPAGAAGATKAKGKGRKRKGAASDPLADL